MQEAAALAVGEEEQSGGTINFGGAVINTLNIMVGVGLLSIPYALKQAGWVGLVLLYALGYVSCYTGKALGDCIATVAKSSGVSCQSIGYEDVAEAAFGSSGKAFLSACMYTELYGICAVLFIIMGDNLLYLFGPSFLPDSAAYMLAAAVAMIPTVWLPDLKSLAVLGVCGIAATTTVSATVFYTLISGSYAPGAVTTLVNLQTVPLVFGMFAFCFAGHGVFPSIRAQMKQPEQFPRVMDVSFLLTALLCTLIGGAGYYMFGSAARDVITFNLPVGVLATLCASLILINPVAKFALTLEPVAAAATDAAEQWTEGLSVGSRRFAVRTALALGALLTARFVPFLGLVMALIGSFLTIAVSIVCPAACHLKICGEGRTGLQNAWDWTVIVVGIICALSGTFASIVSLRAAM